MPVMKYRAQDGTVYPIAHGPKGDKGDTGPQGPQGDPGEVTQAELDAVESAKVDRAGDTMTGRLNVSTSGAPNARALQVISDQDYASMMIRGTSAPSGQQSFLIALESTDNGRLAIRPVTDTGGFQTAGIYIMRDGTVRVPVALESEVPTAVEQVPRLARTPDPTTGDLGLPGYAGSDTGMREVSTLLETEWAIPAPSAVNRATLRRVGFTVFFFMRGHTVGSNGSTIITLPQGFRPTNNRGAYLPITSSTGDSGTLSLDSVTLKCRNYPDAGGVFVSVQWDTTDDWPSSLPGTEITLPTSWT